MATPATGALMGTPASIIAMLLPHTLAMDVLRHRVVVTYEAEAEEKTPEMSIDQILNTVSVP